MALEYLKLLSGSTNGRHIKVTTTATAGTLIHTTSGVAGTLDSFDQLFLYASNTHASTDSILTIEFGGVTDPDDLIKYEVAAGVGPILVVPGLILNNNLTVRAFAANANIINIAGYVYRIPVNQSGLTKMQ